ncbi:MAG TPA: AEC family transporter [Clostridiales bacterium]|nr:AEC family transporter [Clostridiales bacterium]
MFSNFVTVGEQVFILFVLIGVGFICGKKKFMSNKSAKEMTDIVLFFVTPCVIINAYQIDFDINILTNLCITAVCTIAIYIISIIIATVAFRDKDISKRTVLRFGTVFSNCGFMSLPLQSAIIGPEGVLYGSAFIAVFNVMLWSYGVLCMSEDKRGMSFKQLFLNPGVLGVIIALVFFLTSFKLPVIIGKPVEYLAGLNTPLPMIIIGYYLSQNKLASGLRDFTIWKATIVRLVLIPLASFIIMYSVGIRGPILIACVIATSAPTAAATTMFATRFNRSVSISVDLVSITTALSIVTMSLLVAMAQYLGG